MRPTSGAARARRATVPLGRARSWWRQKRGGSSRRPPCCWTWPNSTNTSGTITSGRRATRHVSSAPPGLLVRFIRRLAFPRGRQVRHISFLGLLGPFFQVAVGPPPNSCYSGNTSPNLQALECGRRHFGVCCENLPPRRCRSLRPKRPGFWWRASRRAISLSPRANPQSSSMARTSSSRDTCGSRRSSGTTSAIRRATSGQICSWAGGGGRSSSRGCWRGQRGARNAPGSFGRQGHTLAICLTGSNAGVR